MKFVGKYQLKLSRELLRRKYKLKNTEISLAFIKITRSKRNWISFSCKIIMINFGCFTFQFENFSIVSFVQPTTKQLIANQTKVHYFSKLKHRRHKWQSIRQWFNLRVEFAYSVEYKFMRAMNNTMELNILWQKWLIYAETLCQI